MKLPISFLIAEGPILAQSFNGIKWKLCDYSWCFISRQRLSVVCSVHLRHVRPFVAKIANKTQILCENVFAIYVDNMKLWKYCNILSSNTKFTWLFVTIFLPWATFCDYTRLFPVRLCSIRSFIQRSNLININNLLEYSVNNEEKIKYYWILS